MVPVLMVCVCKLVCSQYLERAGRPRPVDSGLCALPTFFVMLSVGQPGTFVVLQFDFIVEEVPVDIFLLCGVPRASLVWVCVFTEVARWSLGTSCSTFGHLGCLLARLLVWI